MSIFDRNMFRQTSAVSPDVTVIGQGGNVMPRPKINIATPIDTGIGSLNIDAPTFDDISIKEDSFLSDKPTQIGGLGNINDGVILGPNQIALSDGTIVDGTPILNQILDGTIDTSLINRLSSQANREVPLGSAILNAMAKYFAKEGDNVLSREPYTAFLDQSEAGALERFGTQLAPQTFRGRFADAVEMTKGSVEKNLFDPIGKGIDKIQEFLGFTSNPNEAEAFQARVKEYEETRPEILRLGTNLFEVGGDRDTIESIKDLTQRQLQELDTRKAINLEIPEVSQEQMEDDVSEELPTETIAANTIELQDSVQEPSAEDSRAELERSIREGQESPLPTPEDRSPPSEVDFVLSKEERDKFISDDEKYLRDLAIADTFGGQKFKDFLGSMGKQLVRTGSFMGIPFGTADFVESQEGKRAAEAEAEIELTKERIKQAGKGTAGIELKATDYRAFTDRIKENVPFLEGNIQSVKLLEKAMQIVKNNPDSTGGYGLLKSYLSDIKTFFGGDTKNFKNLPAYKQVAIIIESIRQKNLQAVLGESGRTISDRDREIITRVFGDLRQGRASQAELIKLLEQSLAGFKASGKEYKNQIVGDIELLNADPRYAKQTQIFNTPEYDKYKLDYETLTETLINTKKLLDSDIIDIDL